MRRGGRLCRLHGLHCGTCQVEHPFLRFSSLSGVHEIHFHLKQALLRLTYTLFPLVRYCSPTTSLIMSGLRDSSLAATTFARAA